jgi:hypothetical protein
MRAVLLRSLLVIGAGGLVLAGLLYVASTVDARPPEVLSIGVTQPVAGDPAVALITTSIEVAFSEPVEADDAAESLRLDPAVDGAASWSGSTLIFTPAEALELSTAYEVRVEPGVRDLSGNEMTEAPPPFVFETAGRPRIVATDPADGAADVPVEQTIGITFSSLMDTAVVADELRIWPTIRYDLRWSGEELEIVPVEPLRPDTEYEVRVSGEATDAAGVAIGEDVAVSFTTVAPGLRADRVVPADGVDGIAPTTVIAVVFDRPIDPDAIDDDALRISPDVAGSLDVVAVPGEEANDAGGRVLRFTPSGPLPPNTTFDVEVAPDIVPASGGGGLAQGLSWTFTTGAPAATLSNQVAFLSDRSGVANVWAMNPDGTGQHQVSAELAPVLDYAIAPDGSSLVVADGRRLVYLRADGADRRVITADEHWEFDPTYAPSGRVLAFGRADAATGAGLGLWQWEVGGGDPQPIELPDELLASPAPSPSADDASGPGRVLRAPRYSPDGLALAFVDTAGAVGLLELPAQRLTLVPFDAAAPPAWLPDSSAVLLGGTPRDAVGDAEPFSAPVERLVPGTDDAVHRLARSGTATRETALGSGWRLLAVAPDGTIAYATAEGRLGTTPDEDDVDGPLLVGDARIIGAAFAPGDEAMVIVVAEQGATAGRIERLDLADGTRTELTTAGWLPRWLP